MLRSAAVATALATTLAVTLAVLLPSAPSFALTAKDKMATCQFGADDQKLAGKARDSFLKKCMSGRNDPRGSAMPAPQAQPKN